jgi:uncharacterized protein (DUF2267 family)
MSEDEKRDPISTIRAAHDRIDVWFESTRDALTGEQAASACAQLRDVLDSHFAQEEQLYFPTLWRLRPDHEKSLRGLIAAHSNFLGKLDRTAELIDANQLDEAVRCFEELQKLFAAHEVEEEETLRSLA